MQQIIMCFLKFKSRNWKNKLVLDFWIQTCLKLYMMFLSLPRICVSSLQNISPNLSWPLMSVWLVASFALVVGMWNSFSHVLMLVSNSIIWNSRPTFNSSLAYVKVHKTFMRHYNDLQTHILNCNLTIFLSFGKK